VDTLTDVRNGAAQEIAAKDHTADPKGAAEDVVDQITVIRHLSSAGDGRAKGADDGNEAGQDYGLAPISFVKGVGAMEMAFAEKKGVLAAIEGGTGSAADPIANLVAHDGTEHGGNQDPTEGDDAGSGKDSGSDEERVARKEETNEKAGLHEDDQTHQKRATSTNYSFDVIYRVEQVADGFQQAASVLTETGIRNSARARRFEITPQPIR